MRQILVVSADPTDAVRLRIGEEAREIRRALSMARFRDEYAVSDRTAVRPTDLVQALLDVNPQVVHFAGHGTTQGALCLENDRGETCPVSADVLSRLFAQFSSTITCVVLNACYSATQADAIAAMVPYVIGLPDTIEDAAAIAFSVGFYQTLGAGRPIRDAYAIGCLQYEIAGGAAETKPQLIAQRAVEALIEVKDYRLPGDCYISTARKGRTFSNDPVNRQRLAAIMLSGHSEWAFFAVIESLGDASTAIRVTSSVGEALMGTVQEFFAIDGVRRNLEVKPFFEICIAVADLAVKAELMQCSPSVDCGAKMAFGLHLGGKLSLAVAGDCGLGLQRGANAEQQFMMVKPKSWFVIRALSGLHSAAPLGHLATENDLREMGMLAESAPGKCIDVTPVTVDFPGDAETAFVVSHPMPESLAHGRAIFDALHSIGSVPAQTRHLCAELGRNHAESFALAFYRQAGAA